MRAFFVHEASTKMPSHNSCFRKFQNNVEHFTFLKSLSSPPTANSFNIQTMLLLRPQFFSFSRLFRSTNKKTIHQWSNQSMLEWIAFSSTQLYLFLCPFRNSFYLSIFDLNEFPLLPISKLCFLCLKLRFVVALFV